MKQQFYGIRNPVKGYWTGIGWGERKDALWEVGNREADEKAKDLGEGAAVVWKYRQHAWL